MSTENSQLFIREALQKLIEEEGLTQVEIFKKFQQLNIEISKSSISNLWNKKSQIRLPLLKKAASGLQVILAQEYCLSFNKETKSFDKIQNCTPHLIRNEESAKKSTDIFPQDYIIHDGRINVSDKVNLYHYASYEIIEIGIRLRSFSSYFSSKRESAFIDPIAQRLENGVNFKCYVADPQGEFLRKYIEDRAYVNQKESEVLKTISEITRDLKNLFISLNRKGYKGKMSLYQYNHFPYYHASIADGETESGLIYMSPYLYGVTRANTPVIEVAKKKNKILYKKYWQSVQSFINSQQVTQII